MDRVLERTPEGTSPRTYALNHQRPKRSFQGCSRISDYELQGKLGEGTFGYGAFYPTNESDSTDFATPVRFTGHDRARRAPWLL